MDWLSQLIQLFTGSNSTTADFAEKWVLPVFIVLLVGCLIALVVYLVAH